jgi:hypothetical protein
VTEIETDAVLSAIRRGEDSLPKLRSATGLEYAKLHVVLHELEFESRSITRTETAAGFDRYAVTESSGNGFKGVHWKDEHATPIAAPQSLRSTESAAQARELALLQRGAPYCVQCRGVCFLIVNAAGRIEWKCPPCKERFDGSTQPVDMGHIDPECEPKISAMREREILGPEEEEALANMREGIGRSELGDEEASVLDEMRGGELDEEEARIAAEIDAELDESLDPHEEAEKKIAVMVERGRAPREITILGSRPGDLCGCGRDAKHSGRCSYRRARYADGRAASRHRKHHPRQTFDLVQVETAMAQADSVAEGAALLGIPISRLNRRRQWDKQVDEAVKRGRQRRKSGENITKTITSNGSDGHTPAVAENRVSVETPKEAMAKTDEIIARNIPATVDSQGVVLYDSIDDCVTEVVNWPKERMVEFFEAFARAMGLPQRPARTEIKLAWSREFESNDPEGTTGLTYLYLVSMLHHRMEPHEKEAVWTLVQYLKRIECANEDRERVKGAA